MTSISNQSSPQPVDLEARYLRALMERDARIYAERVVARNRIVSNSQVKRSTESAPRPSLSPFEDAYSFGSLR